MSLKKFYNVEIIICYLDHTWTTDYVSVPCPDDVLDFDEAEFKELAIAQWSREEEARLLQCTGLQPTVTYMGIYNVNWDEIIDEHGEPYDENISKCYHCEKEVCFERENSSLPEEYEVCIECDDHVCNDCVDWKYMDKIDDETPICKRCARLKKN
jgi:hypothetical protein